MKTNRLNGRPNQGFALWIYLSLLGISIAGLAGIMSYSMSSANQAARNNEFLATSYVAESAAEKIRAKMQSDSIWGQQYIDRHIATYFTNTISSSDSPIFDGYGFATARVVKNNDQTPVPLGPPFTGFTNVSQKYQIIVTASNNHSLFKLPVTVGMELVMSKMSLFHNAVFWGPKMDLEINPGADMIIGGSVYSGGNMYIDPNSGVKLTFCGDVVSSGSINKFKSPNDPSTNRPAIGTNVLTAYFTNSPLMTLPLGTNQGIGGNTPSAVHAILDVPVAGEDRTDTVGTNRYYNKSDLILTITDTNMEAKSGTYTGNSRALTNIFAFTNSVNPIVNTNDIFYDQREGEFAKTTAINIGALRIYAGTNTELRGYNNGFEYINTIFVVDQRTNFNAFASNNIPASLIGTYKYPWIYGSNTTYHSAYYYHTAFNSFPAVTLTNGSVLPTNGLTVVTPNPLYIKGHYNVSLDGINTSAGTTNVNKTRPGAIFADAINILSINWNNSNSSNSLSSRVAGDTTVNAAFVAGNVPSNASAYSGGLENFPRFLEDWLGRKFTYSGSMVCLFPSLIATGPWPGTGSVYNAPTRVWGFDTNFLGDTAHLPPSAPDTVAPSRGRWAILSPGATNF